MVKPHPTQEDDALLADLGIEVEVKKIPPRTPHEERIIAGFEEIKRFVYENSRLPHHGEGNDIFERLYAVRLDKIQGSAEYRDILERLDSKELFNNVSLLSDNSPDELDDETLLAELGIEEANKTDITKLTHVRPRTEIKAAEEIAQRTPCVDFEKFKPLFEAIQNDLDANARKTIRFRKEAGFTKTDMQQGHFIIIGRQIALIERIGETIKAPNGEDDARLRVIYSNGTESNILLRSLIRAMYKDKSSRLISDLNTGPLFSNKAQGEDTESGTIYVLRSNSDDPYIKKNRAVIHKIGVTGGDIKKRLTNAKDDPTFLMADVEIVATYQLSNICRVKLEKLIHRFFESAKLNIEIKDRFGKPIIPREWFLVPLFVINEAVEKFKEGSMVGFRYDATTGKISKNNE